MVSYTAFLLGEQERAELLEKFPPKYPVVKADHITVQYDVSGFETITKPSLIDVYGIVDDGKGMQALLVAIDNNVMRSDNSYFHITWSLDPEQNIPSRWLSLKQRFAGTEAPYKPVHANNLISESWDTDQMTLLEERIKINPDFVLVTNHDDGSRTVEQMPMMSSPPRIFKP